MLAALTGLLLAAAPSCMPIDGVDRLWKPETRWVIAGETHGTTEMPAIFANMVCLAAATGRPVYVALEYPAKEQELIDAWLASDGGATARAALFMGFLWQLKGQDGRASEAFLELFDQLRVMKQAGRIRGVTAFVPDLPMPVLLQAQKEGRINTVINAGMADDLKAIAAPPGALILTLVGALHAAKTEMTVGSSTFMPAAARLPRDRTISIRIAGNGGEAWNCQGICGPQSNGPVRNVARGLVYPAKSATGERYDVTLELGALTTASPPANRER